MKTTLIYVLGLTLSIGAAQTTSYQEKAYDILRTKCNVCHVKRNPRRVFTKQNMTPWSDDIYQQVSVKQRMPKGNKIKLTNQEYDALYKWISNIKN